MHNIEDLLILSSNTDFVHLKDAVKYGSLPQMCYTLASLTITGTLTRIPGFDKDHRFPLTFNATTFISVSFGKLFILQTACQKYCSLEHATCNSVSS
jgi:hypothetical protein